MSAGQAALVLEELPEDPVSLDDGVDDDEEVEDEVDSDAGAAFVVESPEVVVVSLPVLPASLVEGEVEDDDPRASFL